MFVGKLLDYAIAALAGAIAVQASDSDFLKAQPPLIVILGPPLLSVLTFVFLNLVQYIPLTQVCG